MHGRQPWQGSRGTAEMWPHLPVSHGHPTPNFPPSAFCNPSGLRVPPVDYETLTFQFSGWVLSHLLCISHNALLPADCFHHRLSAGR